MHQSAFGASVFEIVTRRVTVTSHSLFTAVRNVFAHDSMSMSLFIVVVFVVAELSLRLSLRAREGNPVKAHSDYTVVVFGCGRNLEPNPLASHPRTIGYYAPDRASLLKCGFIIAEKFGNSQQWFS
jgi:hypothetical protein